ncbi:hypothetical protein BGZ65_004865, partial [Modicella reniformis]
FPKSEAASLEKLIYRQTVAPLLFLGCYAKPPRRKMTTIASAAATTTTTGTSTRQEEQGEGQDQQTYSNKDDEVLVGYVVSIQSADKNLTTASMISHDPKGASACIHSVCVARDYQRRGIATAMLKEYIKHLQRLNERICSEKDVPLERALLITHQELISLYAGAGFKLVGESSVVHGPDPWFEMVYQL